MIVKYHKDVHLPDELEMKALTVLVRKNGEYVLSRHARVRVTEKAIVLPKRIPFQDVEVIEVTTQEGELEKFLVRFEHCEQDDACISVTKDGVVCTAWRNNRQDRHDTLNTAAYAGGGYG